MGLYKMKYVRTGKEIFSIDGLRKGQRLIYVDEKRGDVVCEFLGCWDDDIRKKAKRKNASSKSLMRYLIAMGMNTPAMGGEAFTVKFIDTGKVERFTEADMLGVPTFFKTDKAPPHGQFYLAEKAK